MSADEKASITKAARDLAKEVNAQIEEAKPKMRKKDPQERAERNRRTAERRRKLRRGEIEKKICAGINLAGKPCRQSVLLPQNWDGTEEITGLYCLHHEPNITRDDAESFRIFGSSKKPVYRRVTPGEIAHQLIQTAPQHFLRPYLRALGLALDPETNEIKRVSTGLKIHGFSRGGQVIQSAYPDYAGQVQITEKLLDRVYGKARQAVDLASTNTTVSVNVVMDLERVSKVAEVLSQAGALANSNGNGNGHVIEGTAEDLPLDDVEVDELT